LLVKFNNSTITPGNAINTSNSNYTGYRDLGIVKTIQEGLFVESKNYQVSVAATADFATIESEVNTYLKTRTGNQVPDEEKAQIITVTKGEEPSATVEKTIAY
jgi:hypothetical protein